MIKRHWAFLAVFAALGLFFFGTIRSGHDWGGDFSVYVMEARNFATHQPFDQTSYVPTPESVTNHPSVYPPLTAMILAPVYATAGLNYSAFKAVLIVFLWLSLPLYYCLACRRGLPPMAAASMLLIFGLSPLVTTVRDTVGSDSVFLFLSAATFLFLDVVYQRHWDQSHAVATALAVSLLLMLCYLTRATGLAVIIAFAIFELWRTGRPRTFGALTILLTATAAVVYTKLAFHVGKQYGTQFPFLPRVYVENALFYLRSPAILWASAPSAVRYALGLAVVCFAIAGFIARLRRFSVVEPYVLLSVAVFVSYSLTANTRYMLAVIPFVLMYAADGLRFVASMAVLSTAPRKMLLAGCALLAVLCSGVNLRALETGPVNVGVAQPSFVEVCSFLKRQTPRDALILSWNPRIFALYTDRRSSLYPQAAGPSTFESSIAGRPAFLVYYDQELDRRKLSSYLTEAAGRVRLVFENRDFRVYALPGA